MRWRRRGQLPVALRALGQPEESTATGELVDALGPRPSEITEQSLGMPVRHVRRLLFASGSEILFANNALVAVRLQLEQSGNTARGVHLADWITGTRNDASLDDLAKALGSHVRTTPHAVPYFALDGGYLQPSFKPGHPWRKQGGLVHLSVRSTSPALTAMPTDVDCPTCSDLLVRGDDGPHRLDIDATIRELTSALAAGLLTEDPGRARIADLRPLHDSGLIDRVESQLTCSSCRRVLCFSLFRDAAPRFDHYAWADASMRPHEPIPPVEQWGDADRIAQAEETLQYVDHQPGGWFLLRRGEDLYLDARYSFSGIIDSSALILLDEAERAEHRARGRESLAELAMRIQDDGPSRQESPYFARDLYRGPDRERYRRAVSAAVADHTWLAEQRRAAGRGEPPAST